MLLESCAKTFALSPGLGQPKEVVCSHAFWLPPSGAFHRQHSRPTSVTRCATVQHANAKARAPRWPRCMSLGRSHKRVRTKWLNYDFIGMSGSHCFEREWGLYILLAFYSPASAFLGDLAYQSERFDSVIDSPVVPHKLRSHSALIHSAMDR